MAQHLLLPHGGGSYGNSPFYFPSRFSFLSCFEFSCDLFGDEKKVSHAVAAGKVAGRDFLLHYIATVGLCNWRWRIWRFCFSVFSFCFHLPLLLANITPRRARTEHCLREKTGRLLGILHTGAGANRGGHWGRLVFLPTPFAAPLFLLVAAKMMIDEVVICLSSIAQPKFERRMTG
jgi:hypothetical protein